MTDYFALLGEPRHPWLETEALKTRFLNLAAEAHPDRTHSASQAEQEAATRRYADLNAAHTTLADTKSRLLHLIELESGQRPAGIEQAPPEMLDQFMEIGRICREADQLAQERQQVTSPMLKVKTFERGLELLGRLQPLQGLLVERMGALELELKGLNSAWDTAPAPGSSERAQRLPLARLAEIARTWSFANRWRSQLHERFVQLAL